jgi:hypothetical protein
MIFLMRKLTHKAARAVSNFLTVLFVVIFGLISFVTLIRGFSNIWEPNLSVDKWPNGYFLSRNEFDRYDAKGYLVAEKDVIKFRVGTFYYLGNTSYSMRG